jgi:hypothetical protein
MCERQYQGRRYGKRGGKERGGDGAGAAVGEGGTDIYFLKFIYNIYVDAQQPSLLRIYRLFLMCSSSTSQRSLSFSAILKVVLLL